MTQEPKQKRRQRSTKSEDVKRPQKSPKARVRPDFAPTLGDIDLHLFGEGRHEKIYEKLGAHCLTHEGKRGVAFAVWAPNANAVSVVGNFNGWDSSKNYLRPLGSSGVWETFVPGLKAGELYKYAITNGGVQFFKADPYGFM